MAIKMSIELPRQRTAPQLARRALGVFADELDPARFYDVRLLVTELVGSAVAAGGTAPMRVEASIDGDLFRGCVLDLGTGFVGETEGIGALEQAGWDLHMVAELSDRWGTLEQQGVWFELDLTLEPPQTADFMRPRGASA